MDNDQIINIVNVLGGKMIIDIDWAGYAWPPQIDKLNFKHFFFVLIVIVKLSLHE